MKNNDWIPVSSGKLPNDMKTIQVTYLGYNDNKPYCDEFAYIKNGSWYWKDDAEKVTVKITAWKTLCTPYTGN